MTDLSAALLGKMGGTVGLAVGAVLAALVVGGVQQLRVSSLNTKLAETEASIAQARADAYAEALKTTTQWQTGVDDALKQMQGLVAANQDAQQKLGDTLRSLSTTTGRLRGDLAGIPARIANASSEAVASYATACTRVVGDLVDAGNRLAERGGAVAAAADRSAAEAVTLDRAWPEK